MSEPSNPFTIKREKLFDGAKFINSPYSGIIMIIIVRDEGIQ